MKRIYSLIGEFCEQIEELSKEYVEFPSPGSTDNSSVDGSSELFIPASINLDYQIIDVLSGCSGNAIAFSPLKPSHMPLTESNISSLILSSSFISNEGDMSLSPRSLSNLSAPKSIFSSSQLDLSDSSKPILTTSESGPSNSECNAIVKPNSATDCVNAPIKADNNSVIDQIHQQNIRLPPTNTTTDPSIESSDKSTESTVPPLGPHAIAPLRLIMANQVSINSLHNEAPTPPSHTANHMPTLYASYRTDDDLKSPEDGLYLSETFELMYDRWKKLHKDFYSAESNLFDLTKVPDVYGQ